MYVCVWCVVCDVMYDVFDAVVCVCDVMYDVFDVVCGVTHV